MSATKKLPDKLLTGQVIAAFGRNYLIKIAGKKDLRCVMRGKKSGLACGDQVEVLPTTSGQGVIERIKPRTTLLYRSDAFREKIIAANISQIIIVVAAVPSFSEELINRCLVAAESQNIKVLIILNKADLIEPSKAAAATLELYQQQGYTLMQLCANQDISALTPYLKHHSSILAGQSGMGKSTILNTLIPEAKRATAEISTALDSGCHTTTHTHLYQLDADSYLIDSPGIQAFGLHHIKNENLAWGFIEFQPYIGQCKFNNCRHTSEPGCALLEAVKQGKVNQRRLSFYHRLLETT